MRASRLPSVRVRILVASLLGAMLCAATAVGLTVVAFGATNHQRLSDLAGVIGEAGLARCEDDPARFVQDEVLFRIWAYTADGRATNPLAPPLDRRRLAGLDDDTSQVFRSHEGPWWRWSAIQRVADSGPCAVLYAEPPDPLPYLPRIRITTLLGVFIGLVGALVATMVLAVRPLVSRLGRLDEAAEGVGMDGFASARDQGDDEIGRISTTLDQAHRRIVADRAERVRRHRALEHHLAAVAHDLRTPLASLQLMLEDLSRQILDGEGSAADTVRDARLEVAYLEALADNLHQATRMTGGLVPGGGEAELTQLVDRVEGRFAILGRLLGGTVAAARPDEPVWIQCLPALAERALANLVHNGILHGSGDVGIVLDASADRFTLTVASAGDRLAPDLVAALRLRSIDEPAGPARTRGERGGRGLGIAIVNAVVIGAGFEVAYEAAEEGGLRVVISGPRLRRAT